MKKIYNAKDEIEAELIRSVLSEQGIESIAKEVSSGDYMKITTGFSVYGMDILVNDEQEAKAKELMKDIVADLSIEDTDMSEEITIPWYRNKTVLARIIIAGTIIIGLSAYVIPNILY